MEADLQRLFFAADFDAFVTLGRVLVREVIERLNVAVFHARQRRLARAFRRHTGCLFLVAWSGASH
jgi:hypothetical protein